MGIHGYTYTLITPEGNKSPVEINQFHFLKMARCLMFLMYTADFDLNTKKNDA